MKYSLYIGNSFLNSYSNVFGEKSKTLSHFIYNIKLSSFKNISLELFLKNKLTSSSGCKLKILLLFSYPPFSGLFSVF